LASWQNNGAERPRRDAQRVANAGPLTTISRRIPHRGIDLARNGGREACGRSRSQEIGGNNGSRNSALAAGCAHSDHHHSCSDLALIVSAAAITGRSLLAEGVSSANESSQSAVSWAAIISGALASVSITLVLIALGAGLGLSSISPGQILARRPPRLQ
jgi:hypothetical protein